MITDNPRPLLEQDVHRGMGNHRCGEIDRLRVWILDELLDVIARIEKHAAPWDDAGIYQRIVRMLDADDLGISGPVADFRQQPFEAWSRRNEQEFAVMRPACFDPPVNPRSVGA